MTEETPSVDQEQGPDSDETKGIDAEAGEGGEFVRPVYLNARGRRRTPRRAR